ncbi:hypothetical protein DPMN_004008 [Dreissena polymorpha]|uniref:Uncharacterized protein n=1 Tax=Dreissena polymorpha TaxID=45954 RepID=A0A9D4RV90_DREPO|nr:hypothetical protein DPMN_004008 [Dreissena polymorpha]
MMKGAVVEWKCREFSRPAEVVPEPRGRRYGCAFQWNQRVYRKVVNEGLATAYAANGDNFLFLRKLVSLSYIPSEHIIPAFEQMMLQTEECDETSVESYYYYYYYYYY